MQNSEANQSKYTDTARRWGLRGARAPLAGQLLGRLGVARRSPESPAVRGREGARGPLTGPTMSSLSPFHYQGNYSLLYKLTM